MNTAGVGEQNFADSVCGHVLDWVCLAPADFGPYLLNVWNFLISVMLLFEMKKQYSRP
jgi:hypothetical protein